MAEVCDMPQLDRIAHDVTEIFGADNVAMAFVTGSIATEYASPASDVDIFLCHRDEPNSRRRGRFNDYYLRLHDELNRTPDEISPGEIMSLDELDAGLQIVGEMTPTLVVPRPVDFDSICWAGMLVSRKRLLVPRTNELDVREEVARNITSRWVGALCNTTVVTEATGEPTDSDKILARKLSCPGYYDAHE